ncbi:MAG TPA: hypothetical protein VJU15_08935 [Gemmatimonadales bacterium]|nr:hypothetical protein [Gemmatimonadales bacterium]
MLLLARLIHVVVGVFWAGTVIFNAWLLAPALRDAGPEGGKVMGALMRRGMMVILPIAGILVILSGFYLYWHASVGFDPAYMRSRPGMVYGLGMTATLLAFLIGILVVRPTMAKLPTADPAEVPKLRARAGTFSTLVALLVGVTVICMAVGRYV